MLASLIPMLLNLFINPLIALNMDPMDYAIVGYYNSFNGLLAPLITFYVFNYYTKRYFEINNDEHFVLKSTIIKTLIYCSLFLSVLSLLALYGYMTLFNKGTEMPFFPYAFFSVMTLPLTGIITIRLVDFKMQRNSKAFFKLSVSQGVLIALVSILLIVVFKLGALGKMSAGFFTTLLFYVYCLSKEYKYLKGKFDWKIFRSLIIFVWPLIIGAMLHFFTNGFDRVYLERIGNSSELGYYVVAGQIVGYISVFSSAIASTFQPDLYEAATKRNWKKLFKITTILLSGTLIIILIFIIFAPYLIDILTAGKYTYSSKYARILAFSQLTSSMYFTVTELTIVLGFTLLSLINKIIGVVFTIAMYSYLITNWQFLGAAWGQVFSFFLLMMINLFFLLVWNKYFNKKTKAAIQEI